MVEMALAPISSQKKFTLVLNHASIDNADCIQRNTVESNYNTSAYEVLPKLYYTKFRLSFQKTVITFTIFGS